MRDQKAPLSNGTAALAATLQGAAASAPEAAASGAIGAGMAQLRSEAARLRNVAPELSKGNLFEVIESAKFNADAARQGSPVRAEVTALNGFPTAPADILLVRNGEVVREVQAKVSRSSTYLSRVHSHNKYAQMDRLVPSDRAARVRRIAGGLAGRFAERGDPRAEQFADTADNVTGELLFGSVRSGGTTVDEAMDAATEPARYADQMEFDALLLEAEVAVGEAVKSGAIFGGAISVLQRALLAVQAEGTPEDVLAGGLEGAARSALRGGATAALGVAVRRGAERLGLQGFARPVPAAALASWLVDAGVTVLRFAKGEISGLETALRLGETGYSTIFGLYGSVIGTAALGPIGGLVGSLASYLLAATTYQPCLAVLQRAHLAEEERQRVTALCEEARLTFIAQREHLKRAFQVRLEAHDQEMAASFVRIDAALTAHDHEDTIAALEDMAALWGRKLGLPPFDEFESFMRTPSGKLVL